MYARGVFNKHATTKCNATSLSGYAIDLIRFNDRIAPCLHRLARQSRKVWFRSFAIFLLFYDYLYANLRFEHFSRKEIRLLVNAHIL